MIPSYIIRHKTNLNVVKIHIFLLNSAICSILLELLAIRELIDISEEAFMQSFLQLFMQR